MKRITNINTTLNPGLTQGRKPKNSVSLYYPHEALLGLASDGTDIPGKHWWGRMSRNPFMWGSLIKEDSGFNKPDS